MNWAHTIKHKITAAIALFTVCAVVVGSNLLERNQICELKKSFSSIYQDRLVVESYIFDLYVQLHRKRELTAELVTKTCIQSVQEELNSINGCIDDIVQAFGATYLTEKEAEEYLALKKKLSSIYQLEGEIAEKESLDAVQLEEYNKETKGAFAHLAVLSEIQTAQGELLSQNADRVIKENHLSSRFEIAILIILGLIIQGLVFSSKKTTLFFDDSQTPSLN